VGAVEIQQKRKRLENRWVLLAVVVTIALLAARSGMTQGSPNFDLSHTQVNSGGGTRQSPNFLIDDGLGQLNTEWISSANFALDGGYLFQARSGGDAYEEDDTCAAATPIATDGSPQSHTFHVVGDRDWLRFAAQVNKSYIIEIRNIGARADAIVNLHDSCGGILQTQGTNAFGSTVRLEWDATRSGNYYLEIQQFDPEAAGSDTDYTVSVTLDTFPPSPPQNLRCVPVSPTSLGMQWRKSPERDVRGYRINFSGVPAGSEDVAGANTTYYELGGLTPNQSYNLRVLAVDFAGNESEPSGQVPCTAQTPVDLSQPALTLTQPGGSAVYTTTAYSLTFTGVATDEGGNLLRAQVRNLTKNVEKWDYSLSGSNAPFRVAEVGLAVGDNNIQVNVFDDAGNSTQRPVVVRRMGQVAGAVLIVAGHNETFGLQSNIYNAANRAYRIFRSAGFGDDNIHYLAPVAQDADGDGVPDTDGASTPAAIQEAVTVWAQSRVGPDKPFFVYLIDHGFVEKFCAAGCNDAGAITPKDLDGWLRTLEEATGVDQVTVVIEACQSGSFVDRDGNDDPIKNSISREGRVIITSTGRENNAYASAQGAYFSDAFFSCVADSNNLKVCFDQAVSAVEATGVNQTPWLDDNGDGFYDSGDGDVAQGRIITRFFSSSRPQIANATLHREGANGTLSAQVIAGAEEIDLVWAVVFPPGFVEPDNVTLNLNVPTVRLEPVPNEPGHYRFNYANGFLEEGDYRIVYYAQDRLGIHAIPRREGEQDLLFLPLVNQN
jgi:hypothetical protein